jgi:2-deoxy-D-gluconate 3-dehydrogenase
MLIYHEDRGEHTMIELPQMPSLTLAGKRALVTGASSGIGMGAATALAHAGAEVICLARGQDKLDETVAAMTQKGWKARSVAADVTDINAMDHLISGETLDIVVNAAGMARHSAAIDTRPDDYDTVMNVNVKAAYFLSTAAARAMMAKGIKGSIIHLSSQMAHVGGIERAVYCASKHAIEGMVKAMAIEWGASGIRINTICPTFIRTPFTEATFQSPEKIEWITSKIKLGRTGEVEDIMGAVLYLASDLSRLVTGSSLLVDGGWTAG